MRARGMMNTLGREPERRTQGLDYRILLRLLEFIRPYKALVAFSLLTMLVYTASIVANPWLIKRAVDSVVTSADTSALTVAALLLAVNAVIGFITNILHLVALSGVGQNLLLGLRTATFNHLQTLPLSFFDRTSVGVNMSRVQNDVQQLQEFLSIFVLMLGDLLTLGGIIVAMLVMEWKLALITLAAIPLLFGLMVAWQRYAWVFFLQVRRNLASVNGSLQENISGVRVIQSIHRQEENLREFDRLSDRYLSSSLKAGRLSSALSPLVDTVTALATGLVIIFGGIMVLEGDLAVGILVAFALYIQRFFDPIRSLTMQYGHMERAMASGSHLFEVLDTEPQVPDRPGAVELTSLRGDVEFQDVSFGYKPDSPVLKRINLRIKPGQNIALIGPTGAGKTTLTSLLARLYEVSEGTITIDGHDIRNVTRRSLNRQIGVVSQEPFLFSGTIRENIRYANVDKTNQEVQDAAKAVGAHDFIAQLELGYETEMEERGLNISPGQRQLIALARALVADPRILILDEAMATVDSHTEMQIQRALKVVLEERTALIVAHRLSTVRDADRIVALDEGRIIEEGTHEELLSLGGLYARMHQLSSIT